MTTKNLVLLNGGKGRSVNPLSHIYEVQAGDGYPVDLLRFDSEKEAKDFGKGLKGNYYVVPTELSAVELVDLALDIKEMEMDFHFEDMDEMERRLQQEKDKRING